MEEKINIAAILKDKPQGTKLYDLLRNIDVKLDEVYVSDVGTYIKCTSTNEVGSTLLFDYSKLGTEEGWLDGLQILKPSNGMRDWSKFAWKKGDVLVSNSGKVKVIFDKFRSNTYLSFIGKYHIDSLECNNPYYQHEGEYATGNFKLEEVDAAQTYINTIEERLGGKLNRKTLEIEKAQSFKDGDIITIMPRIGDKLIYLFKAEDNEKYYGHAFLDGNIAIVNDDSYCQKDFCTTRPSTEKEKQQFLEALAKKHIYWDCEHKKLLDMSIKVELKPFDRVLVRDYNNEVWRANLFSNYTSDGSYGCVCGAYNQCIPYNEETAKLIGTTNNVEG